MIYDEKLLKKREGIFFSVVCHAKFSTVHYSQRWVFLSYWPKEHSKVFLFIWLIRTLNVNYDFLQFVRIYICFIFYSILFLNIQSMNVIVVADRYTIYKSANKIIEMACSFVEGNIIYV